MASLLLLTVAALLLHAAWSLPDAPGIATAESTFSINDLDLLSPLTLSLPALSFTYTQGKTWTAGGQVFAVPDSINYVSVPSSTSMSAAVAGLNALSVAEAWAMAQSFDQSGFLNLWQATASWAVQQLLEMSAAVAGGIGLAMCTFTTAEVQLYPMFSQTANPEFELGVRKLLEPYPEYSGADRETRDAGSALSPDLL